MLRKQDHEKTANEREKRQIVGYDIVYDKSSVKVKRLLDKSLNAAHYYSYAYSEGCYYGTHISLRNKSEA